MDSKGKKVRKAEEQMIISQRAESRGKRK